VVSEFASDGSGKLGPEEEGPLAGVGVEVASESISLLAVESSEVAGDVLPDSLDLGEFGSAAGGGLSISEGPQLFLEFIDVGANGLGVEFADLLVDFLFHHLNKSNIKNQLIFNIFIYPYTMARMYPSPHSASRPAESSSSLKENTQARRQSSSRLTKLATKYSPSYPEIQIPPSPRCRYRPQPRHS
jgi:hypothetical protein